MLDSRNGTYSSMLEDERKRLRTSKRLRNSAFQHTFCVPRINAFPEGPKRLRRGGYVTDMHVKEAAILPIKKKCCGPVLQEFRELLRLVPLN